MHGIPSLALISHAKALSREEGPDEKPSRLSASAPQRLSAFAPQRLRVSQVLSQQVEVPFGPDPIDVDSIN